MCAGHRSGPQQALTLTPQGWGLPAAQGNLFLDRFYAQHF